MFFETLAVAALALRASAQSTTQTAPASTASVSAQTTISAFVDPGLQASIVSANACQTVLALNCDSSSNSSYCDQVSDYGVSAVTLTQKPSALEFAFSTSTAGVVVGLDINCDFQGTSPSWTGEVCTVSAAYSMSGNSSSYSTVVSTSSDVSLEALAVTAGASNLPSSGAVCGATTTGGASSTTGTSHVTSSGASTGTHATSSGASATGASHATTNGAAPTGMSQVYKVLVPVGAAVVAGAGAFL